MERMRALQRCRPKEGILSLSLATFGIHGYSEFSERLDMMVEAGLNQLLLITYNPEIFRLAEIAPAEQHMVNLALEHGCYAEMFMDNVAFVRERYPQLPVIVTPTIGDVLSFGMGNFIRACRQAGADAMDTAQYPSIQDPVGFRRASEKAGIGFINAVSCGGIRLDNAAAVRTMNGLVKTSSGELFLVPSVPGTQKEIRGESFRPYVEHIRAVQQESGTVSPIVFIGGVSTAEQAHELVRVAGGDGVHYSSAFMKRLFDKEPLEKIGDWLRTAKSAMKGGNTQ